MSKIPEGGVSITGLKANNGVCYNLGVGGPPNTFGVGNGGILVNDDTGGCHVLPNTRLNRTDLRNNGFYQSDDVNIGVLMVGVSMDGVPSHRSNVPFKVNAALNEGRAALQQEASLAIAGVSLSTQGMSGSAPPKPSGRQVGS
jgi:hypothetical protein